MEASKDLYPNYSPSILFWLLFSSFSLLCLGFYFSYQQEIFPSLSTIISLSANEAEHKAVLDNQNYSLRLDPNKAFTASSYQTSSYLNNYITLKAGGNKKLNQLLESDNLISSFWSVRLYEEGNPQQHYYFYAPDGRYYGFYIELPESVKLDNISKNQAIAKINQHLQDKPLASIIFSEYKLIDYSSTTQNNGRIDHKFTYEHLNKHIEKAKYKIQVIISGDTITNIQAYVDIPESFQQEYSQMRAYNNTISYIGDVILKIGYGLIMLTSIIIGWRNNSLDWKNAGKCTLAITVLQILATYNELPSIWFYSYDSITSFQMTYIELISDVLRSSINMLLMFGITFIAGDYLARKAFPDHINFWAAWRKDCQSSNEISEQIGIGYGLFSISLGYVALFYITVLALPGFWSPSSNLRDPNIISNLLPFFNPFANSVQAGFWEEFLFRAVPIGAGILIGKKFNKPWIIWPILILQAVIFGMAHANYAQQPYYIRIVELSTIFTLYGLVFVRYGLIPCIISHYLFDVLVMSESLFFTQTPYIIIQQAGSILALAAPFLFHIVQRARAGHVLSSTTLPEHAYNRNWQPPSVANKKSIPHIPSEKISSNLQKSAFTIGIVAAVLLIYNLQKLDVINIKPLTINKQQAIATAQDFVKDKIDINKNWQITARAYQKRARSNLDYLHDKLPKNMFDEILSTRALSSDFGRSNFDNILPYNGWVVRYALFEGNNVEKTESFILNITCKNKPILFQHRLSEEVAGINSTPKEIISLAEQTMLNYKNQLSQYSLIKNQTQTQPSDRIDHNLTFQDKIIEQINSIDLRWKIKILGNTVSGVKNYLNIPQKWLEAYNIQKLQIDTIVEFIQLFCMAAYIFIFFYCLKQASQGLFSLRTFLFVFAGSALTMLCFEINDIPEFIHTRSTIKPLSNQWINFISSIFMSTCHKAGLVSLLLCYNVASQKNYTYQQSSWSIWSTGIMLGITTTSIFILFHHYIADYPAAVDLTQALNSYIPLVQTIGSKLFPLLFSGIFLQTLCEVYNNAAPKQGSYSIVLRLLALLAAVGYSIQSNNFTSIQHIGMLSHLTLLLYIALYNLYVHKNNAIIWGIIAGMISCKTIYYTFMYRQPYAFAWSYQTLSILSIIIISYAITELMIQHQKKLNI